MRSALAAVPGVIRAQVFLEGNEAIVDYDPTRCTVDRLLAAVAGVNDPAMPMQFRASLKK